MKNENQDYIALTKVQPGAGASFSADPRPEIDMAEVTQRQFASGQGVLCLSLDMPDSAILLAVKQALAAGAPFKVIPSQADARGADKQRQFSDLLMNSVRLDGAQPIFDLDANDRPTIEQIKALDNKIFAMLSPEEETVLNFCRQQGRKFGVVVDIINEAPPEELARATTQQQADEIMKRANSRISVHIHQLK